MFPNGPGLHLIGGESLSLPLVFGIIPLIFSMGIQMRLSYRPTQPSDLEECFPLTRDRFVYDNKSQKELLAFWRHLFQIGACHSAVIEDRDKPKGKRVVGFGLSFFAKDSFMLEAKKELPPFLAPRVLEKWKRKEHVFLTKEEIRRANAGAGVNILIPNYGWDIRLSGEEQAKVLHLIPESFAAVHCVYHIKELLEEVYGGGLREMLAAMGCELRRDYSEFKGTPYLAGIAQENHPYLVGFTEESASAKPGTFAAFMLNKKAEPRFHFRAGEQDVLWQALSGAPDPEIAKVLQLSPWTVKKRWQGIYEKVERGDAELLGATAPSKEKSAQRRRHLVEYMRSHPEELSPQLSPPRRKKRNPT